MGASKQSSKKLELRFRAHDVFCHKNTGEKSSITGMLIKVRAKKRTHQIQSVTIEGIVDTEYKFNGMGDFEYFPIEKAPDGTARSIYNDIVPNNDVNEPSYLGEHRAERLFLPAPQFSRTENSHIDVFRKETVDAKGDENIIRTNRSHRKIYGTCIPFSLDGDIPQRAKPDAYDSVKLKLVSQDKINKLKELFQQRPIWIKSGLLETSGMHQETVKVVLPIIAYYYTIGPWRTCWVRFGYDPRRDFEARFYQIIDYRIRKFGNIKEVTERKLGRGNRKFASAKFDENTIPKFSLVFYQYCDINIGQIKLMLERIAAPVPGTLCDDKRGWLPVGFEEQVREIMNDIVHRNYRNMSQKDELSTINDPDEDEDDDLMENDSTDSDMDIDE